MSVIDNVLKANELYAETYTNNNLPSPPALKLAVITCKDARLRVEEMLGLKEGDAHIIRNAGGVVTPDVIRSLLVSHYMLGAQEVMIINHTGCGMMSFTDEQLFTESTAGHRHSGGRARSHTHLHRHRRERPQAG